MGGSDTGSQGGAASAQSVRPELNALVAQSALNVLMNGQGLQNSVSCSAAQQGVNTAEQNLVSLPSFQTLAQTPAWSSLTTALANISQACTGTGSSGGSSSNATSQNSGTTVVTTTTSSNGTTTTTSSNGTPTGNAASDPNLPTCQPGMSPTRPDPEDPNRTITVCNAPAPTTPPSSGAPPSTPAPGGDGYPGMVAKLQQQCESPDTAAEACPQYYQVVANFRQECATPLATLSNFAPTCQWLASSPSSSTPSALVNACSVATQQVQSATVQVEALPGFADVQGSSQWNAFVSASVNFTKCNAN